MKKYICKKCGGRIINTIGSGTKALYDCPKCKVLQGPQFTNTDTLEIRKGTSLFKDGDTWCVLVGENIQVGQLYYGEGKSLHEAISRYLYEETNCFEGSAVEDLVPDVVFNLVRQLLNLTKQKE
jgi:phage FluMu protein Com